MADEAVRLVKESNEIFVRILKLVIVKSLYKDFTFVGVNYISKAKKRPGKCEVSHRGK